ncbi:hypothetical protein [Tessaracoccus sp. OH4464_COT-324]|uniref:hypothetical protein n=1 Tax=Tessaracoccus sp. OH4464_COT-324 TaxID=2491059 RepID=UPI000F62D6C7|nr:hypothetical protein [Tessaracoccus sp. OH4464_COT-324]RRD43699.1 hypothetical protein EII42_12090 [Tessaracoccus sp. OH4464_COT-324]
MAESGRFDDLRRRGREAAERGVRSAGGGAYRPSGDMSHTADFGSLDAAMKQWDERSATADGLYGGSDVRAAGGFFGGSKDRMLGLSDELVPQSPEAGGEFGTITTELKHEITSREEQEEQASLLAKRAWEGE